jgi:hypothetical protein
VIREQRVITMEEHFATPASLEAAASLAWPGEETEMNLLRGAASVPAFRGKLPFWMRRLDNRCAWTYRSAGQNLGMVKLDLTAGEYLRWNFAVTTSGSATATPNACSAFPSSPDQADVSRAIDRHEDCQEIAGHAPKLVKLRAVLGGDLP